MKRLRVTHVIGSLDVGGAERVLCALLAQIDPATTNTSVVTLLDGGALKARLIERGVDVQSLGMSRRFPQPGAVVKLAKHLARRQPAVVVTWLYHANLVGGLAARMAGMPVVWNIRHSTLQARLAKRSTRWVNWCAAWLSHSIPTQTVYVGHAAQQSHAQAGYDTRRSRVIHNGFDGSVYRPDPAARAEVRRELGLAGDVPLVGLFGRFHSDKDHENFARAAGSIHRRLPTVHFLLCGTGVTKDNRQLIDWLQHEQIAGQCHLLGSRTDMPRLTASLDVQVSSSLTEALPNVVGEAMACGVPCAVTDVGDSALLVGDTGRVVPPRNAAALAQACLELLQQAPGEQQKIQQRCRRHIVEHFSFDRMVSQHFALWSEVAGGTIYRRGPIKLSSQRQVA
ncbi:MAG TPA: glycosyltransferase [Pirellulales bacterium]|jgi:glycosyltransferase involved in cell wall biosynthesis